MSSDDDDSKPAWWGEEDKEKQQRHGARKSLMQRIAGASTKKSGSPGATAEPWWEDSGEEEEKREIQPPSDDDGTMETGAVAPSVVPTPASSPISGSEKENTATEAGAGVTKKKKKKRKKKKKKKGVTGTDADAASQPAWWGGNGQGGDDDEMEGNVGTTATSTAAAATADSSTKGPSTITPSNASAGVAEALEGEVSPPASEEPTSNEPTTSDQQATAVVEQESSEGGVSVDPSSAQQPSHVGKDEGSKSVDNAKEGPGETEATTKILKEGGAANRIGAEEQNDTEKNVATDDDADVPEWWDEGKKQKQKEKGGKKERISVLQRIGLAKAPVETETKRNVDAEKAPDEAEATLPPTPMSPRGVADSGGPGDNVKADSGALETDSARSSEWEAIDDSANTAARSETVATTGTEEGAKESVTAPPPTHVPAISEEEDTEQRSGGVASDKKDAGEGEENNDLPAWWDEEKKSKKPSKERKSVLERIGGLAKGTGGGRSPRGGKDDQANEVVAKVDSPAPQMEDKSEDEVGAVADTKDETAADVSSTRPSEVASTSKEAGSAVAVQVPSASLPIAEDEDAKIDEGKEDVPEWWDGGKEKTKRKERKSVFDKIGGLAKGAGSPKAKKEDSSWWQVGAEEPPTAGVNSISAAKEDATMPRSASPSILTGDDVSPGGDFNLAPSKDGEAKGTTISQPSDSVTNDNIAQAGDTVSVSGHGEADGANVTVATTVNSNETMHAPAASTPSAAEDETNRTSGGSSGHTDVHVEDTGEPDWWGEEQKKKDRKSLFEKIGLAKGGTPKDKKGHSATKAAPADVVPPQSIENVTVSAPMEGTEVEEGTTAPNIPPDNAPIAGKKLDSSSDASAEEANNGKSGGASVPAWWDDGQNTKKERKSLFQKIGLAKGTDRIKEDRDNQDDESGVAAFVSAAVTPESQSLILSGSTEKESQQDAKLNTLPISEKITSSETSPQEADKPADAEEGGASQNDSDAPQAPSDTVTGSNQPDEHGAESEESNEKPKQRKSIQGSFYLSSSQEDAVGDHAQVLLDDSPSADENARASKDDSVPAWWDENDKSEKKRISVFDLLRKPNRRETSEGPASQPKTESPTETAADSAAPQSVMASDTSGEGAAPSTDAVPSASSEEEGAPAQVRAVADTDAKMGATMEESGAAEAAASPEPVASDKTAPVGDVAEKELVTVEGEDSGAPAWWDKKETSNQKEKKTNRPDRKSVFELIGLKKSADSAEKRTGDKPKEGDPAWWSSDVANQPTSGSAADVPGSEIASSASADSEADAGEHKSVADAEPAIKQDTGVSGSSVLSGHITEKGDETSCTKDDEVTINSNAPSMPAAKDGNDERAKVVITDAAPSNNVKGPESEEAPVSLPVEDATADLSKPITTKKGSPVDADASAPVWWNEQKRPKKKFLGLFPRKNDESGGGAAYVPSRSADLVTPAMTISSSVEESAPAWWTAQKKRQNDGNKNKKW